MTKLVKAIIVIGGDTTGTRFRPLSMDIPKILFPIADKPLISHIIDNLHLQLSNILTEIILIGFYNSDVINNYLIEVRKVYPDLSIRYLNEINSLGTAGGLYHFKDSILNENPSSEFFFIHADIVCNFPFKEIHDFFINNGSNSLIFGINPINLFNNYHNENFVKIYDNKKILNNYGTIVAGKISNRVIHYVEKPQSKFSKLDEESKSEYNILLNGGIYLFNNEFFNSLEMYKNLKLRDTNCSSIESPNPDSLSLEIDVLKNLPFHNEKFYVFISKSFWYQVKTPISALLSNNFYLEQELQKTRFKNLTHSSLSILPPVLINNFSPSEFLYRIGPNVSIGKNSKIGKGVRIKNSIILDDVEIGDNSFISNAIISNNVKIGKWCRVEGTLHNKKLSDSNFKSLSNMVIICHGSSVHDNMLVYNSIVLPMKEIKEETKYEIVM